MTEPEAKETDLEKYSIKVNILNRPYPLLVNPQEEEAVRTAARLINEKVKLYKEKFSVKDDLDLVIMCCLELATDNLNQRSLMKEAKSEADERMAQIHEALNSAILHAEEAGTQP